CMKKFTTALTIVVALVAFVAMAATPAMATISKRSSCSGCHGSSTSVKVAVTKVSSTTKSVKYKVRVTGGRGTAAWAVLAGSKNLARRRASSGYFTLPIGKKVRVWGVKTSTGARYRALTAKR
ncbi:MAG: hypothetical protein HY876_00845, partial [Coriobacteriales bacterium]|nr:hypothetical protein [Coriobacteriales bacterium]